MALGLVAIVAVIILVVVCSRRNRRKRNEAVKAKARYVVFHPGSSRFRIWHNCVTNYFADTKQSFRRSNFLILLTLSC